MLDNFGFGEFFTLALLALLFFGPEQLPRIGARIGRWIRTMTQYSRSFLNEWREEALVISDALAEVKGIRDEVFAARAELASTMNTARTELSEAVDGAKMDVQGQIRDGTQIRIAPANETSGIALASNAPAGRATSSAARQAASGARPAAAPAPSAEDKTQQILDRLAASKGTAGASAPAREQGAVPTGSGASHRATLAQPATQRPAPVSPSELNRLRGDVSALSAHVSTLHGELARLRAALKASMPADPADDEAAHAGTPDAAGEGARGLP